MSRTRGQHLLSFFKVILGKKFDKLLYIPPNVAPLISEMNGRRTYLRDSLGEMWEVSVSEVDSLLAFQQGWNDFFTGHDLEYGDFLVFLFTGSYFDVEVYNKSAVQRVNFQNSSQVKKRTRKDRQRIYPLDDFPELTTIRLMKKETSRKGNIESDKPGKRSSARRLHTRKDQSQFERDSVNREKRKRSRFQYQYSTETNGDTESPPLYRSRNDRSDSESNTVERDDFEETLPHFHSQEGQPQFKRRTNGERESPSLLRGSKDRSQSDVEIDDFEETTQFEKENVETDGGDRENPSLYCGSKDGSESGRNGVEVDDFEETSLFKRHDVGDRENSSSSRIKKTDIQPKREFFDDSFFGFAWEHVKNTHNEARTAVLDLSEFEVWGGCCTNQSAGIKSAAVRSGFGDKDQGTSSCDVRTNETSNCASEVAAKVKADGTMSGYKSKSDAPVATKKEKGHILSGYYPREPEPTTVATSSPVSVSAKKEKSHMMPADHQEREYNKRVPPVVSGSAVPVIKKEGTGADALPFDLAKNKTTAQGAAMPVIKKEGMGADAFLFNFTKNKPAAQEKPTISAKTEPKVETFTDWSLKPLRALATNPSFLMQELPSELLGETRSEVRSDKACSASGFV